MRVVGQGRVGSSGDPAGWTESVSGDLTGRDWTIRPPRACEASPLPMCGAVRGSKSLVGMPTRQYLATGLHRVEPVA